jgi:uncharacterized protein YuzE
MSEGTSTHRVLSVVLNEREVHRTRQLDDAHLVDVDANGEAVGIEILTLDNWKIDEMAERFGFSEQATAIKEAIDRVMTPTGTAVSYGVPKIVPAKTVLAPSRTERRIRNPNVDDHLTGM